MPMISKFNLRVIIFLSAVLIFSAAPHVHGHRVTIFAWVEGNTVYTQSKFSSGKKVSGGEISVLDMKGNLLLKGQTDENGGFSFQAADAKPMKIILNAGMGHQGEWLLTESDFGKGIEADPVDLSMETTHPEVLPSVNGHGSIDATQGISEEQLKQAVEKALDKKLEPLYHIILESHDTKPSVSDIVGGIGYIIGLVGLAAYIHSRRKEPGQS
jgi:nickel transport protein